MGVLRLASTETKKIDLGDEDFIEVKTDLSKRDFNVLLKLLPPDYDSDKGFSPGQADDFMTALFGMLVTGWSLTDDSPDKSPVPVSVDSYLGIAREGTTLIDEKLIEHFNGLQPSAAESKSGKGPSK